MNGLNFVKSFISSKYKYEKVRGRTLPNFYFIKAFGKSDKFGDISED